MNDLLAERAAKRKPASNSASNNKPTAEISSASAVSKGKKPNSKRQAAKESPKKTNSPARLAPKNKSKKESPKSTNQKRGIGSTNSRTRIDSPMAKISIDDEKENKRSSPRKRNRDSSSGSQSSSSQSSQVYIYRKLHPRIPQRNSPTLMFCCPQSVDPHSSPCIVQQVSYSGVRPPIKVVVLLKNIIKKSSPQPKKGLKSGKQAKTVKVEATVTKTRSGRTSKRAKT